MKLSNIMRQDKNFFLIKQVNQYQQYKQRDPVTEKIFNKN